MALRGLNVAVVGAGVVGLSTARALQLRGAQAIVLEKGFKAGAGISARNSGVIHAGIYYPEGSLKAKLCVKGRKMLYDYCKLRGVEHVVREKLVVATNEKQLGALEEIAKRSRANGLSSATGDALELLTQAQAQSLEPHLACVAALRSPSTGVVDASALLLALQGDVEAMGGIVVFDYQVTSIDPNNHGGDAMCKVTTTKGDFQFDGVVNCAGLAATQVAKLVSPGNDGNGPQNEPSWTVPALRLAKGNYFKVQGTKVPFSRLIYPVPEEGGLGVHVTIDVHGQARFGPDVEWLAEGTLPEQISWEVNPERVRGFYQAIRSYWPGLPDDSLAPDYAGVRPKIQGTTDFSIVGKETTGVARVVHALGIESPGLTSSLALGEYLADRLQQSL